MSRLCAAPYYEQIHGLYADIKSAYERLNRLQSRLDRQISDIYHELERCEIDEAAGYSAALILQETLRKRRIVKDELFKLRPIFHMLKHNIGAMDESYMKANTNSVKVRRNLNTTLTISDIEGVTP